MKLLNGTIKILDPEKNVLCEKDVDWLTISEEGINLGTCMPGLASVFEIYDENNNLIVDGVIDGAPEVPADSFLNIALKQLQRFLTKMKWLPFFKGRMRKIV